MTKMITLYQFPVSHYCEKVRWALSYKNIEYKVNNILPGFHIKKLKKLSGQHSVPVLKEGDNVISGSASIIDYIEQKYPEHPLIPKEESLRAQALEWQKLADDEVGVHARRVCYGALLSHPEILIKLLSSGSAFYHPILFRLFYSKFKTSLTRYYKITPENVEISRNRIIEILETISNRTKTSKFLVGDQFTVADLSFAALFAPFFAPEKYGVDWPQGYQSAIKSSIESFEDKLIWAKEIYQQYR